MFCRATRHRPRLFEHDFVAVKQSRDLHGHLFTSFWGPWNEGRLGDVVGHGDADPTQQLDPLGDGIDELALLVSVLVEEQMQLGERGPDTCQ